MATKNDEELFGDEHVRAYQETNGERGFRWRNGTTILLLTTTGRKSGQERTTPLIFREVDGTPVIVASKGGAPEHPGWFVNIEADPDVTVQIRDEVRPVRARVAGPGERPRLWDAMVEVWPDYEDYQERTDREIPLVLLEPR